ncbi:hypothetical protein GCWU000325_00458 [Alloprevotella tannerae ATCC 51259]|uniref:Uncharacterized protein n=1 Tax=Alloprevotella tannerae ATCC 51259 TaxID=626522 RepID=C9LE34_9BACT|nr:hypothetical protein GCWU000325_00458 [Alloprevotella tannerae ATCC 51259]
MRADVGKNALVGPFAYSRVVHGAIRMAALHFGSCSCGTLFWIFSFTRWAFFFLWRLILCFN